jgi:hypothetical protein
LQILSILTHTHNINKSQKNIFETLVFSVVVIIVQA